MQFLQIIEIDENIPSGNFLGGNFQGEGAVAIRQSEHDGSEISGCEFFSEGFFNNLSTWWGILVIDGLSIMDASEGPKYALVSFIHSTLISIILLFIIFK